MDRFCRYCGGETIPGNAFCRFCGKPQEAPTTMATPGIAADSEAALTRQDFIVIGALLALALLLILIFIIT